MVPIVTTLPTWSEKIDERGFPVDPLNANRSRNRVRNLFAHGTITSITLRLRYASIFCWALDQLSEETENKYAQLKSVEKLFCLSSRYRQLQADHGGEALRGMDGNSRFSYDEAEFDEMNLEDLELLKNDGYAYSQFYENQLQNFLLKRGEFELTAAGAELAGILESQIGDEGDRVLDCARRGYAERADFEAFSQAFANQSLYLESECEKERQALQKVLLGFFNWSGDRGTGTVELADNVPAELTLDVLDHLHSTIDSGKLEEAGAGKLFQKYNRGYHNYRAAHSCFLCRSWQLQSGTTDERIELSESDKQKFKQYRDLMRLYWLQSYAGYAIEAQLEALCTFLNARIPPRYDYETLLDEAAEKIKIQNEFKSLTEGLEVSVGSEEMSPSQITRDLMLYGVAEDAEPDVSVTSTEAADEITVGEAQAVMAEAISGGWENSPAVSGGSRCNEVLLGKALRNSLDGMSDNINDQAKQFEYWAESLARSSALLLLAVTRFERVKQRHEWLYNYAYNRFDTPYASISELSRLVDRTADDTPLHEFARSLIDEKVVETHLRVFYSRLGPGNLKRAISFDQDERLCLEVDADRDSRPFVSGAPFIRFDEMNTLLRDAGLLTDAEDGYKPTDTSLEILSRIGEVSQS